MSARQLNWQALLLTVVQLCAVLLPVGFVLAWQADPAMLRAVHVVPGEAQPLAELAQSLRAADARETWAVAWAAMAVVVTLGCVWSLPRGLRPGAQFAWAFVPAAGMLALTLAGIEPAQVALSVLTVVAGFGIIARTGAAGAGGQAAAGLLLSVTVFWLAGPLYGSLAAGTSAAVALGSRRTGAALASAAAAAVILATALTRSTLATDVSLGAPAGAWASWVVFAVLGAYMLAMAAWRGVDDSRQRERAAPARRRPGKAEASDDGGGRSAGTWPAAGRVRWTVLVMAAFAILLVGDHVLGLAAARPESPAASSRPGDAATAGAQERSAASGGTEAISLQARFNEAFRRKQWDRILTLATQVPLGEYTPLFNHDVNRALYHTGRLPEDMFRYPQNYLGLTLLIYHDKYIKLDYSSDVFMREADTFYELGLVNDAERWAHERLQIEGEKPGILKLLAQVNLVKGELPAARVFLHHMVRKFPGRPAAQWAQQVLADLKRDPQLEDYPDIQRLRASRPVVDSITSKRNVEHQLLGLLKRNPQNRMALEYLMAHYLLTCDITKVYANLHRLDAFDDQSIPRSWERAVCIYLFLRGHLSRDRRVVGDVDLCGRTLRQTTIEETLDVHRRLVGYRPDDSGRKLVAQKIAPIYGKTYFNYYYAMLPLLMPMMHKEE